MFSFILSSSSNNIEDQNTAEFAVVNGGSDEKVATVVTTTEMSIVATAESTSSSSLEDVEMNGAIQCWVGALAAIILLFFCVGANVLLMLSIRRRTPVPSSSSSTIVSNSYCRRTISNGSNNNNNNTNGDNVKGLIGLIAGLGLLNGSCICIMQIVALLIGDEIFSDTYCKLHGMASNLMSLLIIWYQALLGFERYVKFVKPQDYQITFSKMNLKVIQLGIVFVLLFALSGPTFGWGTYTYLTDIHSCHFDLNAANSVSYFVLTTVSYVLTPYAIMGYSCLALLLNMHCCGVNDTSKDTFTSAPWNSMERHSVIMPLALTVVASFVLQLPMYVSSIEEALDPSITIEPTLLYIRSWLQTFAINCCFACLMLTFCVCRRCLSLRRKPAEKSRFPFRESTSMLKDRENLDLPSNLDTGSSGNTLEKLCSCWLVSIAQQPKPIKLSRLPTR